ncbi:Uncharacterised protein [Mycobacterium tuberculosis]|nr:Uncharacterised protein [Mycobacterium tuberculosis]
MTLDNFFNSQIDSCHEGDAIIGVMTEGQPFSLIAKDDFLMGYQTWQTN